MATAENSALYFEVGQALVPMVELVDSGDHKAFNSAAELWSDESGFSPVVKPNGVLTGLVVIPSATGALDKVDISAGTLNLGGAVVTHAGGIDNVCARGVTADICRINSITITSAGAIAVVSGVDNTAFSETRGANGGPPLIPVGSVELAQVRFSAIATAVVAAAEIFKVPNSHREMAYYPSILRIDFSRAEGVVLGVAGVQFSPALMLNHTGAITKKVFAQYYEPDFAEVAMAGDFQPAANTLTTSSQPYYGGALGEVNVSLKGGKFKAFLNDGITDAILLKEGKKIWFKYQTDRLQTDKYILTQGTLGVVAQYPSRGSIFADFTINANDPGKRIYG